MMADTCVVGDTSCSAPSTKASEKENLQDPCSCLQQPSHPSLTSQVSKKSPPSLLSLSRRPLRENRNLQEPNVNSAVIAEDGKNSQECISLSAGRSLKCPGATYQVLNVTMTGPAVDSFTASQENVNSSYVKNIKDPPRSMTGDSASLSNRQSVLDVPNRTWLNPEVTFFPSVQERLEKNSDLKDQVGLQLSCNNGSHQQTFESLASNHSSAVYSLKQFLKSEHRKCLTPIWEMSPLREGETVMGGEGDRNMEKMESLFQSFFAQECANVIDNIRRTSLRGAGGQFCAKGCLDTLEVTGIEEESLPNWTGLNSTLEWSCFQPEKEAVRSNAVCLDSKEKVKAAMPAEKVEEVSEASGGCSASFSSKESFVSVVMGKTQSIHESHVLEASLKDTHSLCDDSNCKGKTFLKSDVENTNWTYVLPSDNPQAGQNVTVNLTDPKTLFSDIEADKMRSKSNCNDTYELQHVPEAVRKDCDGIRETEEQGLMKVTPSSSENAHLAESICNDNVDAEDRVGINGISFNDSLDFKDRFLVTSTPMPMPKSFHFTKDPDAAMLEQYEQHSVVDAVAGCLKGDTMNLGGADGSVTASTATEPPAVNVKATKSFPKPTTLAVRQDPSASSSKTSGQRKFLLRSSAIHSSAKTQLPSAQAYATRRMSLPALPQTAPQVSAAPAPPSHPSAPVCFEKKSELTSGSSCGSVKTASCLETPGVAAPGAKRHSITAKHLTTSGLQKPRVSGLLTCTTRLGLKPHGVTVPTEGMKGRSLQLPTAAQKKPHSNTDACSASKRRRIDAHSTSTEAPKGSAKLAGGPQGLRKLTKCLKDLELKSKPSETSCITRGTPKVPARPVRSTQGLRRPATGLKGLESKLKNSEPGPLLNVPASIADVSGNLASTSEHEKCAAATVATDTLQQTDCGNCVRYREEIARLKAALRLISGKDKKKMQ
ncbi:uncharacterized protein LOC108934267 isoform X2 [Scleropages formosus]|uniref:uncharacterized protein LOC108934267 isoform X2 n=1 Tax=Scleropages formosus TaxID=113540 RepID=UPI0008781E73|nr:uncharacterized protein LOC108934267 isoform X2 [Scleropages formosus]